MSILVGTASWTDKTLIACGRFYPCGCSTPEARLQYYASQFPIVEVDSSYYAMPAASTAQLWAERTPAAFTFNIKAFRLFTGHQTSPLVLPRDLQKSVVQASGSRNVFYRGVAPELRNEMWRRFREALDPLGRAGKLGAVHFQFPPWIEADRAGRAHVEHCVERMAGITTSVEFRHRSWWSGAQSSSTLAFERELGVVHTVVDGPQGFDNSVPDVWASTHPRMALVRLHGRNTSPWNIRGASASSDRFNYDYSEGELRPVSLKVRELSDHSPITHVVFNNNMEDQGQRNALAMARLLSTSDRDACTVLRSPRSSAATALALSGRWATATDRTT